MLSIIITLCLAILMWCVCRTMARISRSEKANTTSVIIRTIPESAMTALCQSILDETERLKMCQDENERESIRNYLKEMSLLLVAGHHDTEDQEETQEHTLP